MSDAAIYGDDGHHGPNLHDTASPVWTHFSSYAASPRPPAPDAPRPLTFRWLILMADDMAVLIATLVVAVGQSREISHYHAVSSMLSDLVALLFLFATSRAATASPLGAPGGIWRQIRLRLIYVFVAGSLQGCVLMALGVDRAHAFEHVLLWLAACTSALTAVRAAGDFALSHPELSRKITRRYAVVGDGHCALWLQRMLGKAERGIEVVGVFDDQLRPSDHVSVHDPVRSSLDDLIGISQDCALEGIIIALPPSVDDEARLLRVTRLLRGAMTDVYVMPYLMHRPELALPMQQVGKIPLLVLQRRPLDEWQTMRKRLLDVILSMIAITILLPLFAIVALLIKLDSPGPVLFRQPRRGFNNRSFMVLKFRSMHHAASDYLAARQTSRQDARVTRVGKWLRRLSIDELPQLINVLRGEMSLVGPRPHAPHTSVEGRLLTDAIGDYALRYRVKPGITGWAQVNGARGELVTVDDLRRRLAFDFEYIQRWSIGFDLKIMALTALREILSRHAF